MARITLLGMGNMGKTLGTRWAQSGHHITFGVRDVEQAQTQIPPHVPPDTVAVDTIPAAITRGDIIVFAIPGAAVNTIVSTHAALLANKVIIDATNRTNESELSNVSLLSSQVPTATIFRAFNSLGWENFADPHFDQTVADLFYCGTPGDAQSTVDQLIADIGVRPVYIGSLEQVYIIDTIGALWFALVFGKGHSRHLAFKMLTREQRR